ncbi:hypothetical protein SLE2022_396800 [Rubroshorea leprosula]
MLKLTQELPAIQNKSAEIMEVIRSSGNHRNSSFRIRFHHKVVEIPMNYNNKITQVVPENTASPCSTRIPFKGLVNDKLNTTRRGFGLSKEAMNFGLNSDRGRNGAPEVN